MFEPVSLRAQSLTLLGLMVLLVLTVGMNYVEIVGFHAVISMSIAIAKTALVALYFMELRYGSRLSRLIFVAGLAWLFLLFFMSFLDLWTRSSLVQGFPLSPSP